MILSSKEPKCHCPQGHSMTLNVSLTWLCDVCGQHTDDNRSMACRPCDYDLCISCAVCSIAAAPGMCNGCRSNPIHTPTSWFCASCIADATHRKVMDTVFRGGTTSTKRIDKALLDVPHLSIGGMTAFYTLAQFSSAFFFLIKQNQSPRAFCGAAAPALAQIARDLFMSWGWPQVLTREQKAALEDALCDIDAFARYTDAALAFYRRSRERYIATHRSAFRNDAEVTAYLQAWIANYEVSDYLRSVGEGHSHQIPFFRENQWPDRPHATHEEFERLAAEERFGGELQGRAPNTEKVFPNPTKDHCSFIDVAGTFFTVKEYVASNGPSKTPIIAVLDVGGHFACAVGYLDEEGTPQTTLFNTLPGSLASYPMIHLFHDVTFFNEIRG